MKRLAVVRLALLLACLWGFAPLPSFAQGFSPAGLKDEAAAYVDALRKTAPPDIKGDDRKLSAKKAEQDGDAAAKANDQVRAAEMYERAVGLGGPQFGVLMKLSRAWSAQPTPSHQRAAQAAYAAYQAAGTAANTGAALWRLADLFDGPLNGPRQARAALRAIIQKANDDPKKLEALHPAQRDGVGPRLLELRRRLGVAMVEVKAEAEQARPRICARFDEYLAVGGTVRFEDFVALNPAPSELLADVEGARLCLSGLSHGTVYRLTLREGLPGRDGVALKKNIETAVIVPDRAPSLVFRAGGRVLPKTGAQAVPFSAVNVDAAEARIYRINDRALVPFAQGEGFSEETAPWRADQLADHQGELVWRGVIDIPMRANQDVVSAVPFAAAVPRPQPGFYAITLDPKGVGEGAKPWGAATQWVQVSDIGLSSFSGVDGVTAFARSLSTARPLAGATLTLVARNNAELARATADADGRVSFPAGFSRASGGATPHAVMAYGADGDFAMLDLSQPAFDLSDRGVGGRNPPGPLDAYVYADRGVYRQGETVNLTALLRDDRTVATGNFPLTVKVLRPNGGEYLSQALTANAAGAAVLAVKLSPTAPLGGWTVKVFADPNRPPVGGARFAVEDFIPERLAVELTPEAPQIGEGDQPFRVAVAGRFLYGAPAAGLGGTAEWRVEADAKPYPAFADYAFGLAGETLTPQSEALEMEPADEQGRATVAVALDKLPDVSLPLRARIDVSLLEPGGRPATASVTLPIRRQPFAIGLKLADGGTRGQEGAPTRLAVVALDRAGQSVAAPGLDWTLVRERPEFQWYMEEGRYRYRAVRHDETVASGRLDVAAGPAPTLLDVGPSLPVGRYRLQVAGGDGLPASRRFTIGWEPPDEPGDTPDMLELTADRPAYRHGDTARLKIAPPFAGEALVTVATDRLHLTRTLSVGPEGAVVDIPVDAAAWGPGAYVTATVYRPPSDGGERRPVRAVGVAWLAVDPSARSLNVALSAPAVARPRGPVSVTVKATDAAGAAPDEDTFITLAAVDEGILRLTRFVSPDPTRHYFGKRALGVDIRDDYGHLIAPFDGVMGKLREGGDASSAGLPALPFGLVSLFQGPVKLDAAGTATLSFDIPDFNGELRLMAVAFSARRLGAAAAPLTVRDPLAAEAYFPRFLAPGDASQVALSLHNVDAPAGEYTVTLTGADGLKVPDGAFSRKITLATGRREGFTAPLLAGREEGIGRAALTVVGPDGFNIARNYELTIRSPRPVQRSFTADRLEPGREVRLTAVDLADFRPQDAALTATFGASPPFDIAGILDSLRRYPYGCVEQTVSAALPLLAVERLEKALGVAKPDQAAAARVQDAIHRLLDRQGYEGAFSPWGGGDEIHFWLTGYVGEFLVRARQAGRFVPDAPLNNLLGFLERHAVDGGSSPGELVSRAYALHVMTLAGTATVSPLRYFHDAFIGQLSTPLAQAQIAAALARFGDKSRAAHAYGLAVAKLARKPDAAADYGSTLRDAAAVLRLGLETGLAQPHLDALLARLPAAETAAIRTNTQEQAWLVLAAEALTRDSAPPLNLTVRGATARGRDPVTLSPDAAQLAAGVSIANNGAAAVWRTLSVSGVPVAPPASMAEGLKLTRRFHYRDGKALDPATVKQNDVFVVALEGKSTANVAHQLMLTQPLPAGWEIERAVTPDDVAEGGPFAEWLGTLSETRRVEPRDDRFNAALDLAANAPPLGDGALDRSVAFRVAFVVRAVTPGDYELPGAMAEDMYQPRFRAQLAWGRVNVGAAQ